MRSFNSEEQLYVLDQQKWKKFCEKDYSISDPPSVTELENGFLLPLKRREELKNVKAYAGGACDHNGNFVAGIYRNLNNSAGHLSCTKAYPIPAQFEIRHETVVFGGILYGHFGHLITDGLVRLWWFADHLDTQYKLVFLDMPAQGGFKYYNVLEAAGITKDRMEIITKPTQFDRIIVPQESLYQWTGYRPGMKKIYDLIRSRAVPGQYRKVFLSRSRISEGSETFNEMYFENFYRRRGYQIVYPEQLPFEEQVSIMAGAEEVVLINGTLAELTQFCNAYRTRVVILNRCDDTHLSINICLQGGDIEYYVIDAYFNFLPAAHAGGHSVYFLGPTIYWKQYLDCAQIPYEPEEISFDLHVRPFVYDYVVKWGKNAASNAGYNEIHNSSLIDVVDSINSTFLQTQIERNTLSDRDDIIKYKQENENLKNKVAILESLFKDALIEISQSHPEVLQNISKDLKLND